MVTVNALPATVTGAASALCYGTALTATFSNTLGANETINIYEDAALTIPASPASVNTGSWTSDDTYTTTTSIWAIIVNSDTSCKSLTALELVFSLNQTDTDGDGLTDCEETTGMDDPATTVVPTGVTSATDPCDPAQVAGYTGYDATNTIWAAADCDADGVINATEVANSTDPYNTDSDADGVTDGDEATNGTDPLNPDTDSDTISDGDEATDGTDPLNGCDSIGGTPPDITVCDTDGDGLSNDEEAALGTDPNNPDSDDDGINDGQEVLDNTNPLEDCDSLNGTALGTSDCDADGLTNDEETTGVDDPSTAANPNGEITDPNNMDSDGDRISDGQEALDETDPNDSCDSVGGTPAPGAACDISIESDLLLPSNGGVFKIVNIELFPNNTVRIFNRWGVVVFEADGYDNTSNTFRGTSKGRVTLKQNEELPVGVYYYVINYDVNGTGQSKTGYLYINR